MKITPDDLRWWLQLAPTLEWTWAKTYADSAPHDYIVLDRCPMGREDFVRAGAIIRTFGQPGKFWSSTNIYLTDGQWKWWTMDPVVGDTDLINRATADRAYGIQDAPSTFTGQFTEYDAIANEYDRTRDRSRDDVVTRRVSDHFGDYAPTTLDVGCGTGVLLDRGITSPEIYTGIDPSQGMLNELVFKHPDVHRVIPSSFQEARGLEEHYDLVVAVNVPEVDLGQLTRLGAELLVFEAP